MEFAIIGDIHGMYDMLDALLEQLPATRPLVFLGDYIDRGPQSCQVISRLMRLREERECIFLRGNHEDMALRALDGGGIRVEELWYVNGGLKTLESYDWHLPKEDQIFLAQTLFYHETDEYLFVHGGLVPGRKPADTNPDELIWMREPFLHSHYNWGKLVIHGHTPTHTGYPDVLPNRINIDTGAVYGRRLTGLLLPEKEFCFAEYPSPEEAIPEQEEPEKLAE